MNRIVFGIAATVSILAVQASAHDFVSGAITVMHPMAFETAETAVTGAGYMRIANTGTEDDRLTGVQADFPRVMLHLSEERDGVATMTHLDDVVIPAGETVTFAPGGLHVMFMGLGGDPFEVGEAIPATLVFELAGEVEVEFVVEARGATTCGGAAGSPEADCGHGAH